MNKIILLRAQLFLLYFQWLPWHQLLIRILSEKVPSFCKLLHWLLLLLHCINYFLRLQIRLWKTNRQLLRSMKHRIGLHKRLNPKRILKTQQIIKQLLHKAFRHHRSHTRLIRLTQKEVEAVFGTNLIRVYQGAFKYILTLIQSFQCIVDVKISVAHFEFDAELVEVIGQVSGLAD